MIQESHFWIYIQRKWNLYIEEISALPVIALFTIAKMWKQHKCPLIDEWMKQIWHIFYIIFMHFFNHNKGGNPTFLTTRMNLEDIILCELSNQTEKRQKLYDLTYMWNHLDKKQNLCRNKVEWWLLEAVELGKMWDIGNTLLVIRLVGSEDLIHSLLNAVLCTWKLLREYLKYSHHTHSFTHTHTHTHTLVIMWMMDVLTLLW